MNRAKHFIHNNQQHSAVTDHPDIIRDLHGGPWTLVPPYEFTTHRYRVKHDDDIEDKPKSRYFVHAQAFTLDTTDPALSAYVSASPRWITTDWPTYLAAASWKECSECSALPVVPNLNCIHTMRRAARYALTHDLPVPANIPQYIQREARRDLRITHITRTLDPEA